MPESRSGEPRSVRVGVLALQGDTREHLAALREAGADAVTVRRRGELDAVDALVIPGGESTTMTHLLREFELLEPLRSRLTEGMPAYGSCAGMILLASEILDAGAAGREAAPLKAIDMTVRRNAFGRQVDSFEGDIAFDGLDRPVHAVFIRAPWVERIGPDVRVLCRGGQPYRRGSAGPDAGDVVSSRDDRRPPHPPNCSSTSSPAARDADPLSGFLCVEQVASRVIEDRERGIPDVGDLVAAPLA